jgi:DNA modification methylase
MSLQILQGDCRQTLLSVPDDSVDCCVTSPPYWGLRDYGVAGQLGQEATPEEFIATMTAVFREVRRILKPEGTCWVNMGDSYSAGGMGKGSGKQTTNRGTQTGGHMDKPRKAPPGYKPKDLVGQPWMLAFALRADGWYLRQDIIWSKPNPMPESVTDRCTKAHEYIFLLTKSARYFYDHEAIKEQSVCGHPPGNRTHRSATEYDKGDERHRTKTGLVAYAGRVRESAAKGSFSGKTESMAETGQNAFRAITNERNKRSVWTVPSAPFKEAHFATYPPDLIKPCILAGCPVGGTVLDPFGGSGTTGAVALELGRKAILCELNPEYVGIMRRRTSVTVGLAL